MAMHRSARLRRQVHLLGRAADSLRGSADSAAKLCREVLGAAVGDEDYLVGASALNNDGVPLQLCFSSSARGVGLRIIGDPGAHHVALSDRYRCARAALDHCVASHASPEISPLVDAALTQLIPEGEARDRYTNGFVWIAASPDRPGVAFYVDLAPWGADAAWDQLEQWLAAMAPHDRASTPALAALRRHTVPASAGLEGHGLDDLRAKIYFRLKESLPLEHLGVGLFADKQVYEFLELAMGDFGIDADGLVLCVGFHVATGELADVKVDLCGHCLRYTDDQWPAVVDRLVSRFDLTPLPVEEALHEHGCRVAFIGFGLDGGGARRMNLYLNAAEPRGAAARDELEAAITDGVRYLCSLQREDGEWTDYDLPVGASDEWITAYVGLALARVGNQAGVEEAIAAAERAAQWLCSRRAYNAGWGYNGMTGPDSDSTAMALGLLREIGWPVRPEDQRFLRDRWRASGGLATYEGPEAWGTAHWDVTPLGYLGLSEADQNELRDSFLVALHDSRLPGGMWRAYWWRSPFYGTLLTLETLAELEIDEPERLAGDGQLDVDNAFDLACLLGIQRIRSDWTENSQSALRGLLNWQQADGRWPGHANLRVTDDGCFAPWEQPVGEYYRDDAATLTTATVLRVLTLMLASQPFQAVPAEMSLGQP